MRFLFVALVLVAASAGARADVPFYTEADLKNEPGKTGNGLSLVAQCVNGLCGGVQGDAKSLAVAPVRQEPTLRERFRERLANRPRLFVGRGCR